MIPASSPVTVLITVYNGAKYLGAAIESILGQTMSNFELLIIDDASTDSSREVISRYQDPRIRCIFQSPNRGIHGTLNRGMKEASAPYLAIMDQDDIAKSSRLEEQLNHLQSNQSVAICGSAIETFGDHPKPSWVQYFSPEEIKTALLFGNPICHPSVMMNRADLNTLGLNYPHIPFAEEYALWVNISRVRQLTNLSQPLLKYRSHPQQVSRVRSVKQSSSINRLLLDQLGLLGLSPTPFEHRLHLILGEAFIPLPALETSLQTWVEKLVSANKASRLYSNAEFEAQLRDRLKRSINRVNHTLGGMSWLNRLRWGLRTRIRANSPLEN